MTIDAPLYSRRDGVDPRARAAAEAILPGGTAGRHRALGTIGTLDHWIRGGTFHRYGISAYEALRLEGLSIDEALEQMRVRPASLELEGTLRSGGRGVYWSLQYHRVGLTEEYGGNSGYSTAEDCAYEALVLIEEHERAVYENNLVVGLA